MDHGILPLNDDTISKLQMKLPQASAPDPIILHPDEAPNIIQSGTKTSRHSCTTSTTSHPLIATFVHNCYSRPSQLFVIGDIKIACVNWINLLLTTSEGTTQGDLVSMTVYVIAIIPLILMILRSEKVTLKAH